MQSKYDSILESITNVVIGGAVALTTQLIWFPLIGKEFTFGENLMTMAFFTLISFLRSYTIRRLFNGKSVYKFLKG